MKENYTDITILLDRSPSMSVVRGETIQGYNIFLEEQRKVAGDATISLIQFDRGYESIYEGMDLDEAPKLTKGTYQLQGMTALWDAMARAIHSTGERLRNMKKADRPQNVVFVIITDGEENSSREVRDPSVLSDMITTQQDTYSWEFVFLGANQDAITTGRDFGIKRGSSMTFAHNTVGTRSVYDSVSKNLASYRCGTKEDMTFTSSDIKAQKDAGVDG
jgi:hypothetical protein